MKCHGKEGEAPRRHHTQMWLRPLRLMLVTAQLCVPFLILALSASAGLVGCQKDGSEAARRDAALAALTTRQSAASTAQMLATRPSAVCGSLPLAARRAR